MSRKVKKTFADAIAILDVDPNGRICLTASSARKIGLACALLTDTVRAIARGVTEATILTEVVRKLTGNDSLTNEQARETIISKNGAFHLPISKHNSPYAEGYVAPGDLVPEEPEEEEAMSKADRLARALSGAVPADDSDESLPVDPVAYQKDGGWYEYEGRNVRRADLPEGTEIVDER